MGHRVFGNLIKYRHVVTYSLSPYEQRPFAGFSKSFGNMYRRASEGFWNAGPALILGIVVYKWANDANAATHRKNPADYAEGAAPAHH
ncbi:UcrQ family protein [Capsaspora owczarzaki ATCC 30864]|nr:UcrQ family protein [Capsaspora owczarzaki ATCC 30864]|eukprot:XP_004342911.1 UcrQ family protein [Capsaspora owczarzaki ATCC 30864]